MRFLLLSTAFLAVTVLGSTFGPGDSVSWVIDLRDKYPSGVFCRKIEAYIAPAESGIIESDASQSHFIGMSAGTDFAPGDFRHKLIASTSLQHPNMPNAFTTEVEVGNRYKLNWAVSSNKINGQFQFKLVCVHPGLAGQRNMQIKRVERSIVAVSSTFQITASSSQTQKEESTETYLKDISPPDYFDDDDNFLCPISKTRPERPVIDGHHTFDAVNLKKFLETQPPHELMCPYRHKIDRVQINEQMLARIQKYSEDFVDEVIEKDIWCFADEEARNSDLETKQIFKVAFQKGTVSQSRPNEVQQVTQEDLFRAKIALIRAAERRETIILLALDASQLIAPLISWMMALRRYRVLSEHGTTSAYYSELQQALQRSERIYAMLGLSPSFLPRSSDSLESILTKMKTGLYVTLGILAAAGCIRVAVSVLINAMNRQEYADLIEQLQEMQDSVSEDDSRRTTESLTGLSAVLEGGEPNYE